MGQQFRLGDNLETFRGRMGQHEVSVLIECDQLLIGPDEVRFGDAPLLPVNLTAADIDGREDRLAALAAASEVDRVADSHGVAVM